MSAPERASDRNLLFGILALQMDFISRDALLRGMNAWVLDKSKPLGQILVEQGAMAADARALLEPLVQKHIQMHGDDPAKSLASVGSVGSARRALGRVVDADVQASLAQFPATGSAGADAWATRAPSVGTPTSAGLRFRVLRPHARGGLGQVSVALDEELRREVALKEIQDRYADHPDSRARFLLEAEVTGGLEHPGIVPVYGLGSYPDGRPFYAMRFIKGDSLQEAIARFHKAEDGKRDPHERALALRQLLGRFIDVCDAIAYAHSRGVLHRDLKPGNVMLGPYGETLVVDWGLAKAMGGGATEENGTVLERPLQPQASGNSAPTQMGSAIGTPAYMPPEQAAGRLDELGPASDVYSLGATLYCLLTGKAPFEGGDVGEVLRHVQRGDFPRPREVNRGVPAALEAVCLKAMALRLADRYPGPRALAADVERWLADEPVSAWREPWTIRAARWARRHRALVNSTAAAMLALLVSAVPAFVLIMTSRDAAIRSEHKAVKLADEKGRLAEEKGRLAEEKARLAVANEDLAERRLSTAARSLLRPLVFQDKDEWEWPPLSEPEIEALWELGGSGDEKLRLRFVQEAIREPMTTRQLRYRAEFALHAAVGLDLDRREAVERLMAERLSRAEVPLGQGADLSLNLASLGGIEPQTAGPAVATLAKALSKATDKKELHLWSKGVVTLAARLEPREAAAILIQAMRDATSAYALMNLSRGLAEVAARLDPKEAAATLTQAMSQTAEPDSLEALSEGLAAVAASLEGREAAAACARAAAYLGRAMRGATAPYALAALSRGLTAVAAVMEPREAVAACARAAAALDQAMRKTTHHFTLENLARGLAAVTARLDPGDAAAACARSGASLDQAIRTERNVHALAALSRGLAALAPRLERREAATTCARAAASLAQVMSKTKVYPDLEVLSESMSAVAAHLEPGEAAAILERAMSQATNCNALEVLSRGLAAVAALMEPREAVAACARAAATLDRAMNKATSPYELGTLSRGLAAVAARLERREAAPACARAASSLARAMRGATTHYDLIHLSRGLAAVATHLEPRQAAATLDQAMSKATSPYALAALAEGLPALAARRESSETTATCARAAAALDRAIREERNPYEFEDLARGLAAVAARLEPKEAKQAAMTLTEAMSKAPVTTASRSLALSPSLTTIVTREAQALRSRRFRSVAGSVGMTTPPAALPLAPAVLAPALEPLPEPLPPQMLVDLLKHPLCVGQARRVVLDALGTRYHRTFADQWDFVRFATQQRLNLDLTSPPKRPEPTAVPQQAGAPRR